MKLMNNTRTPHIFIVDDSITDCLLISSSLRQLGFELGFIFAGIAYFYLRRVELAASNQYCYSTSLQELVIAPTCQFHGSSEMK